MSLFYFLPLSTPLPCFTFPVTKLFIFREIVIMCQSSELFIRLDINKIGNNIESMSEYNNSLALADKPSLSVMKANQQCTAG